MSSARRPAVLETLHDREAVLATVRGESLSLSSVADRVPASRATVDRALDAFADAGLVVERDGEYAATAAGDLALRRLERLEDDGWTRADLDLIEKRGDVVDALATEQAHKPAIVERLGQSRSTVDRAVGALEDAGWVERGRGGFGTTAEGRNALATYRSYLDDQRALLDAAPVLAVLPASTDLPPSLVTDGTVDATDPRYRLFESLAESLDGTETYRAVLPRVTDSRQLRVTRQPVADGELALEFLAPASVHDRLVEEFPHLTADLAAGPDTVVGRAETPPYGLFVLDGAAEDERVLVVTYDDGVAGVLESSAPEAVRWARERVDAVRGVATDVGDEWARATASGDLSRLTGERLPARLRTQGFVRVDGPFLDDREPLSPAVAWRAGVGLADVEAGYTIPRYPDGTATSEGDDAARSLAETVAERLLDGEDVAVLGPTGSGKSTVCKRVAVRWARRHDGVVLYRESGRGQPFTAPGALAALLERASGPTLVVVEDAVRAETAPTFDVMRRFSGDDDVTVLVDARESEWTAPDDVLDSANLDAHRRHRVETVRVPPLTAATCERVLDHGRTLMDDLPSVPPAELLASVQDHAGDDAAPGAAFLLFHRLARYAAPLADYRPGGPRSTLDEHVDRVRADLGEIGERATEVGVLCALLAAAGVGVTAGHLYALAETGDEVETVRAAVDRLEGDVLFESPGYDGYRTIQRTWAVRFLARLIDHDEGRAQRRFGRALTALLALADDSTRRDRVARSVGGDASVLDAVLSDPQRWADDTVRSSFEVGLEYPRLAPLFGTTDGSTIDLPAACSTATRIDCVAWRGRANATAGEFDRAHREFDRLVDEAEQLGGALADRTRFAGLLGLADVARRQGDLDVASEHGETGLSVAAGLGEESTGRARLALGRIARARSEYDEAETHLDAALSAFDGEDRLAHGAVWDELGEIATRRGAYDRARECYANSESIYEAVGDARGTARARSNAGDIAFQTSDYERAVEEYRRARDLARVTGDRSHESEILEMMGAATYMHSESDGAESYYREALEVAREIGERRRVASILGDVGYLAAERGDRDRAAACYDEAIEIAREIGAEELVAKTLRNVVTLEMGRGDLEAATESALDGIEIARQIGDRRFETTFLREHGTILLRAGRLRESRDCLTEALAVAREIEDIGAQALVVFALFRAAFRSANLRGAEAHARAYHRLVDRLPDERTIGVHPNVTTGVLARERGDIGEARTAFRAAHESDRGQSPTYTATLLAATERRLGNERVAGDLLSTASAAVDGDRRRGFLALERGRNRVDTGDLDGATESFATAWAQFEGTDHHLATAALCGRAVVKRRRGDEAGAVADFRTVFARYRDAGATRHAARVAVALAALVEERDDDLEAWAERGESLSPAPWQAL